MHDKYSADYLDEEVYQYLVETYPESVREGRIGGIVVGVIFGGAPLMMMIFANSVFGDNLFNAFNIFCIFFMLIGIMMSFSLIIFPKLTMKHLKERDFTYHIGRVTDKKVETHNDSTKHYVYVDGKKYGDLLKKDDYGLAEPGDEYIIIYVKGKPVFCTRIQEIGTQAIETPPSKVILTKTTETPATQHTVRKKVSHDRYSADFLSEEVHQYLVGQYEEKSAKGSKVVLIFGLIFLGMGAPSIILPLVMQIFVFKEFEPMLLPFIITFIVIGLIVYFIRKSLGSTAKLMKEKQYTYHIGTVTDKEIVTHRDSDGHTSREYCVYVDGYKYSNLLHRKEDYELAEPGDRYILVYVKGNCLFCTRVQEIYHPEREREFHEMAE